MIESSYQIKTLLFIFSLDTNVDPTKPDLLGDITDSSARESSDSAHQKSSNTQGRVCVSYCSAKARDDMTTLSIDRQTVITDNC